MKHVKKFVSPLWRTKKSVRKKRMLIENPKRECPTEGREAWQIKLLAIILFLEHGMLVLNLKVSHFFSSYKTLLTVSNFFCPAPE
jgi:hypothetical protein